MLWKVFSFFLPRPKWWVAWRGPCRRYGKRPDVILLRFTPQRWDYIAGPFKAEDDAERELSKARRLINPPTYPRSFARMANNKDHE